MGKAIKCTLIVVYRSSTRGDVRLALKVSGKWREQVLHEGRMIKGSRVWPIFLSAPLDMTSN